MSNQLMEAEASLPSGLGADHRDAALAALRGDHDSAHPWFREQLTKFAAESSDELLEALLCDPYTRVRWQLAARAPQPWVIDRLLADPDRSVVSATLANKAISTEQVSVVLARTNGFPTAGNDKEYVLREICRHPKTSRADLDTLPAKLVLSTREDLVTLDTDPPMMGEVISQLMVDDNMYTLGEARAMALALLG